MSLAFNNTLEYDVYLGVWTNWSRGAVLGYTLSLTRESGNLLIAFVAFFVAYTGTRFWRIMCFAYHSLDPSSHGREAFHHQRQAVFRNAATAESGLLSFVQIVWAWRKTSKQVWLSTLPAFAMTILCSVAFVIASGYSSQISSGMGEEILLKGDNCAWVDSNGIVPSTTEDVINIAGTWRTYESQVWINSANYAQECYNQIGASGFMGCKTFSEEKLPFTVDTNANCPFSDGICRNEHGNIFIDSGPLDSNDHFGLNAPADQRIQWRKTMHCAPLTTEGYKENATDRSGRPTTRYLYGKSMSVRGPRNFSYEYSSERDYGFNEFGSTGYTLGQISRGLLDGSDDYLPIDELRRDDGTTTLVFLSSNGMPFLRRTTDAWFSATIPGPKGLTQPGMNVSLTQSYYMDEPASPLVCLEQEQLCFNSNGSHVCTPLTSTRNMPVHVEALISDQTQLNRIVWMYNVLTSPSQLLQGLLSNLQSYSLLARFTIASNIQGPLSDTQWHQEVQYWFASIMAGVQQAFVRAAMGPTPELVMYSQGPLGDQSMEMCKNQKIRSTNFASFSMFALLFVSIAGSLIIIASFAIEPCLLLLKRKSIIKGHSDLEWATNSTLQLQRMAYQAVGTGTWQNLTEDIPITMSGETMAALDITNPDEPKLSRNNLEIMDAGGKTGVPDPMGPGSLDGISEDNSTRVIDDYHPNELASSSRASISSRSGNEHRTSNRHMP